MEVTVLQGVQKSPTSFRPSRPWESPRRFSARLRDAGDERAQLAKQPTSAARGKVDSKAAFDAYKRMMMRLQEELSADVPRARNALAGILDEVRLSKVGNEVWADVKTRAAPFCLRWARMLLIAVAGTCFMTRNPGRSGWSIGWLMP